jgi:hypothetical protein
VDDDKITIGTRLWRLEEWRPRVFDRSSGKMVSAPYEDHFREATVIGETKGTWLVGEERAATTRHAARVNKRTLREPMSGGYSGGQWFTDAGKDADIWQRCKRHEIVEQVRQCDVATLKKIAELLGDPR